MVVEITTGLIIPLFALCGLKSYWELLGLTPSRGSAV
jgi:hypothetical protein